MKTYLIRCMAGGFVIGSRFEDDFGNPLTKQSAKKIAMQENRMAEIRAKENGCTTRFEFVAVSLSSPQSKPLLGHPGSKETTT